jgi:curved DNA-binding protein CbpA
MAGTGDYYEILQVSPNADEEVIQAAYKRLAFKWHPDRRPGDPAAPERMKLLNAAYAVLSDPQKRRAYDVRRKQPTPPEAAAEPADRQRGVRPRGDRRKALHGYLREASHVQPFAGWFVAISLADVLMTYVLLRAGPHFYESNPVAQWFFHRWNILGMTLFKFALVGGVVALSEVIERKRPGWGRLVLLAGCGVTGFALARGLRLYVGLDD